MSISSMGKGGSNMSSGNGSSSVSSSGNWGSGNMSSNWDMGDSVDRGGNSLGDSLDGVGAGLVDNWLGDGLGGGKGGGDMGVGGLSHRVGQGGDLGDDLSEGMSLSGGVSEVSSKSVVLDGSRVVSWGTDKVGGCVTHNSISWCHSDGASTGKSDERGEKQEGVHGGSR